MNGRFRPLKSEIGVRLLKVYFLDPNIPVQDIVPFGLKFQAAGCISYSFAFIVSTIKAGIWAAPNLVDDLVLVRLDAVKVHCHHCFLYKLAIFETCCSEDYVISIPFSQAIV